MGLKSSKMPKSNLRRINIRLDKKKGRRGRQAGSRSIVPVVHAPPHASCSSHTTSDVKVHGIVMSACFQCSFLLDNFIDFQTIVAA